MKLTLAQGNERRALAEAIFLKPRAMGIFDNRMSLLCWLDRPAEAQRECMLAIDKELSGGVEKLGKGGRIITFPMMVLDWIEASPDVSGKLPASVR